MSTPKKKPAPKKIHLSTKEVVFTAKDAATPTPAGILKDQMVDKGHKKAPPDAEKIEKLHSAIDDLAGQVEENSVVSKAMNEEFEYYDNQQALSEAFLLLQALGNAGFERLELKPRGDVLIDKRVAWEVLIVITHERGSKTLTHRDPNPVKALLMALDSLRDDNHSSSWSMRRLLRLIDGKPEWRPLAKTLQPSHAFALAK